MGERWLTQEEVAARLRCSTVTIKRLRLSGQLAYSPGRPVLISETALEAYVGQITVLCEQKPKSPKHEPHQLSPEDADARAWAVKAVLRVKLGKPRRR
jgi:excisionase family DNA binding protein